MTNHVNIPKDNEFTYTFAKTDSGCYHLEIFWGQKPSGGYRIRIDQWDISDNNLHVTVKTTKPKPGDMVTMALTYPKATATLCDFRLHEKLDIVIKKSIS